MICKKGHCVDDFILDEASIFAAIAIKMVDFLSKMRI
jgi:hypothetical protein